MRLIRQFSLVKCLMRLFSAGLNLSTIMILSWTTKFIGTQDLRWIFSAYLPCLLLVNFSGTKITAKCQNLFQALITSLKFQLLIASENQISHLQFQLLPQLYRIHQQCQLKLFQERASLHWLGLSITMAELQLMIIKLTGNLLQIQFGLIQLDQPTIFRLIL